MSISLSAGSLAVAVNVSTSFYAQGGTAPYVYSVAAGGCGGTIDPVTGIYKAPSALNTDAKKQFDTVIATDNLSATASAQILVASPLSLVCDIIQTELGLNQGQVYLWDQKINITKDSNLYIAIDVSSCRPFGNSTTYDSTSGFNAVQSVNMLEKMDINIFSRGGLARDRKEEIVLALNSVYSQQQQQLNNFFIGKIPLGFINLSEEDGSAVLYRFVISVNLQYSFKKTKAAPFANVFSTVPVTNQS
jgi:hypothetical protein